jgi:hypothetical protein
MTNRTLLKGKKSPALKLTLWAAFLKGIRLVGIFCSVCPVSIKKALFSKPTVAVNVSTDTPLLQRLFVAVDSKEENS